MRTQDAMASLITNMDDIKRLMEIHKEKGGATPGRKYDLEVLNKSAIVLLVACWEAFIEDLVANAFDVMLASAKKHDVFPFDVLTLASRQLKDSQDARLVWTLAGDGWREVLKQHKSTVIAQHVGKLNTPKPKQIDALLSSMLGIASISQQWFWRGMSADGAREGLEELVKLRGSIAHRVSCTRSVVKADVTNNRTFIYRLAVITSNRVLAYVHAKTGEKPWGRYHIGSVE